VKETTAVPSFQWTHDFRIADGTAFVAGAWSDSLAQVLRSEAPTRLELVGDWPDLSVFDGQVASVTELTLAGTLENGKVRTLDGLRVFTALQRLTLATTPKPTPAGADDLAVLGRLTSLDAPWQGWMARAVFSPNMRSIILRGFPEPDLAGIPASSSLESLWLQRPAIQRLSGIARLSGLAELRITDATKLVSLDELETLRLGALDIENAKSLTDASAVAHAINLRRLRIVNAAIEVDLAKLTALETLHIGGKSAPAIDWPSAMVLPRLRKAFAWWEPARHSEEQIRNALGAGRRIVKFDAMGGKTRKTLFVDIAEAQAVT
jgi:hypothetical protein